MLPHAVHTHRHATVPAAPGLAPDGAAAQRIEARHGHAIGALTEALAEHRLAWHAAREDGDFGRILQSELRYAEAAAAIADALRSRGEPDDAVEAYLKAKRREIDTWAPFALPSLRRWGVFARRGAAGSAAVGGEASAHPSTPMTSSGGRRGRA